MSFADSTALEINIKYSLPQIEYPIPIINEFIKNGPFHQPRLFILMGHAQSYKTSIAVELLTPFLSFQNLDCEALWLDCDYKFPIDLLKTKKLNLTKLKVAQCRCSEEIIFNLLSVENYIETENGSSLRAIVIDAISSSFWIDASSGKLSCNTRYILKEIVERFVNCHGITMIVVMEDLGFDPWTKFDNTPVMKLVCSSKTPGKGQLIYETFVESFTILDNRSFRWGNNRLIANPDEKQENDNDEANDQQS